MRSKELYRACSILGVSTTAQPGTAGFSARAAAHAVPQLAQSRRLRCGLAAHRRLKHLQVEPEDVVLVDDARLPDGMHQRWQPEAVAEHVAQAVQRFRPSQVCCLVMVLSARLPRALRQLAALFHATSSLAACPTPVSCAARPQVYTFDGGGVSGHPNHLAAAAGVLHWWAASPSSSSPASLPQVWQLETVALPRKYAGLLDAPFSWVSKVLRQRQHSGGVQLCVNLRRPRRAWRALFAHGSQMVW